MVVAGSSALLNGLGQVAWNFVILVGYLIAIVIVRPFRLQYKNVGLVAVIVASLLSNLSSVLTDPAVALHDTAAILGYIVVAICLGFMVAVSLVFFGIIIVRSIWFVFPPFSPCLCACLCQWWVARGYARSRGLLDGWTWMNSCAACAGV